MTRFRLRSGHKDYLLHAAQSSSHSASELLRKSLAEMLASNWSPWDAGGHLTEERDALDGCEIPRSRFRYRETPWVSLNVQLSPELLEAVRTEARRLSVGRDALVRAALFQFLTYHYELPPNQHQFPSEQELGYSTLTAPDGWPVDPRHPANLSNELLARKVASIELTRFARLLEEDPEEFSVLAPRYAEFITGYAEFIRPGATRQPLTQQQDTEEQEDDDEAT